jgi:hypothetical protein
MLRFIALVAAGFVFTADTASAKGIMIITHGDTVSDLGAPTGPAAKVLDLMYGPGTRVGYKYSYGGLFWIDVWTWDGGYCLHRDNSAETITKEQAAEFLGTTPDKLGKPFFYRFPHVPFFLIVIGLPVLIFKVMQARKQDGTEG